MRRKLSLVTFIFLLISLIVLFSEPSIINYFLNGHHNWVSLHSLAIVKNTNFNTGFVGYTCKTLSLDGSTNYLYFNRYPFFFALIAKFILSPWQNNTESYLYFARQLMNIIYLINLFFLYKISRKFSFGRFPSIASVLITGSSIHWLYYKNIFFFDQPALLAFTILIYLLLDLKLINSQGEESINNKKFYFYVCFLLLIGRSYNIIFFIFSCLILAFYSKKSIFFKIRKQLLIAICIGSLILLANLIYNISIESFINNINWRSTSIIDSLMRRIELIKVFDFNNHSILEIDNKNWFSSFIPRILIDILFFFSPIMAIIFSFHAFSIMFNFISKNAAFSFKKYWTGDHLIFNKNQAVILKNRGIFFDLLKSLLLTHIFWTIVFSNLVYAHDYASMYIIPTLFMGTIYIVQLYWNKLDDLINQNKLRNINTKNRNLNLIKIKRALIPLSLIFLVFNFFLSVKIFANHSLSRASNQDKLELSKFFKEIDSYNQLLSSKNNFFIKFDKDWIPGSPYAMCSLLNNSLYSGESKPPSNSISAELPKLDSNRVSRRISIKRQTYRYLKKIF